MTAPLTPAQVLRDAKALISDPARWTQKAAARDGRGYYRDPRNRAATCWCSIGAIWRVCFDSDTSTGAEINANHWLGTVVGGCIVAFNDTHTHAEVMAAFDRAIELAEAGQ